VAPSQATALVAAAKVIEAVAVKAAVHQNLRDDHLLPAGAKDASYG